MHEMRYSLDRKVLDNLAASGGTSRRNKSMFKAIVIFIVSFIIAVLFAAFAFPANAAESVCDSPEWWEKYEGAHYEGTWNTVDGAGKISVSLSCLYAPQQARFEVIDGSKTYRWTSRLAFKDSPTTLVFTTPPGFPRVDTYTRGDEGRSLRGGYTFEGRDRGKVSLSLRVGPTKYLRVKSVAALEDLKFEGQWHVYNKPDALSFHGRQMVRFESPMTRRATMVTFKENGEMSGNPWRPEVVLSGDTIRLVGTTRVDIFRLRVENGSTIILEGITFQKGVYTQAIVIKAMISPEQLFQLR